jgi:hypothetical protein
MPQVERFTQPFPGIFFSEIIAIALLERSLAMTAIASMS